MDVSNSTGETTDYKVTVKGTPPPQAAPLGRRASVRFATVHSGSLQPSSFHEDIPLPPGTSWLVQFFKTGSRTAVATKTVRDAGCLVVLVQTESGLHRILVCKRAIAA